MAQGDPHTAIGSFRQYGGCSNCGAQEEVVDISLGNRSSIRLCTARCAPALVNSFALHGIVASRRRARAEQVRDLREGPEKKAALRITGLTLPQEAAIRRIARHEDFVSWLTPEGGFDTLPYRKGKPEAAYTVHWFDCQGVLHSYAIAPDGLILPLLCTSR